MNKQNEMPYWLAEAMAGRTVWEGIVWGGTTALNIIRQPGDPVYLTEEELKGAA
jgi:hypothetical protein